jgi:hypothetical protein
VTVADRVPDQERPAEPQPPARSTLGAGLLVLALSLAFLMRGIASLLLARNPGLGDRRVLAVLGISPGDSASSTVLVGAAIVTLVLTALATLVAVGVLRRHPWAREGGIVLFGLFAVVLIMLSLQGLTAAPRAPTAVWGMVIGVLNAAVVTLLLRPATTRDMEQAEVARRRSRNARGAS